MLYAVRYEERFASRQEEPSRQRALSERLLQWALTEPYPRLGLLRSQPHPFGRGRGEPSPL